MIQAVLFDLGETLVNFVGVDYYEAFRRGAARAHDYLRERSQPVPDLETYHRLQLRAMKRAYLRSHFSRRDCHAVEVMARINRRMGLTTQPEDLRHLTGLFYEAVREQGTPEPGLHEVLQWLQRRGCKLGIISNTIVPGFALDEHLRREDLIDHFPIRLYSCDVGCRKPQRRIFRMALTAMDVEARNAMFVGDKLRPDVNGANRVGMISVLKRPAGRPPWGLTRPDHVITALRELPELIERCDGAIRRDDSRNPTGSRD